MIERIEINLLPAEYRIHKRGLHLQREVIYPLLVFSIAALVFLYMNIHIEFRIREEKQTIEDYKLQIKKNAYIKKEIDKLTADKKQKRDKIRALKLIGINEAKWVRLMELFCMNTPPNTWLISLKEKSGASSPTLTIQGHTLSFPEVAQFMDALTATDDVLSVHLSNIERIGSTQESFQFNLTANLNPEALLSSSNRQPTSLKKGG